MRSSVLAWIRNLVVVFLKCPHHLQCDRWNLLNNSIFRIHGKICVYALHDKKIHYRRIIWIELLHSQRKHIPKRKLKNAHIDAKIFRRMRVRMTWNFAIGILRFHISRWFIQVIYVNEFMWFHSLFFSQSIIRSKEISAISPNQYEQKRYSCIALSFYDWKWFFVACTSTNDFNLRKVSIAWSFIYERQIEWRIQN